VLEVKVARDARDKKDDEEDDEEDETVALDTIPPHGITKTFGLLLELEGLWGGRDKIPQSSSTSMCGTVLCYHGWSAMVND